jgi:hypothetical protein
VPAADPRWRNPEWHAELHRRARRYYSERVGQTGGSEQPRVLFDYLYLHRNNPLMRPYLDWQVNGTTLTDVIRDGDRESLRTMANTHEGSESAGWLDDWFERQLDAFVIDRDTTGQPAPFVTTLALNEASAADRSGDPATRAAWEYLEHRAPFARARRRFIFDSGWPATAINRCPDFRA